MWPLALLSKLGPLLMSPVTQFVTGINIGQIIQVVFNNITKYWKFYLLAFLIVLQLTTAYGWDRDHKALVAERVAHKADVQAYKKAQQDATNAANTERNQVIKESELKANATDKQYRSLLSQYNASLLRYETTHRSTSVPTNQGDNKAGEVAAGTLGPSTGPQLSITLDDAKICSINTARLQAAHDWAIGLNSN